MKNETISNDTISNNNTMNTMNTKLKNKSQNKTKNRLIIIGASGHGRVVADIAALNVYDDIIFLDGDSSISTCAGYPVLGLDTEADRFEGDVFIAVGNAEARKKLMDKYSNRFFPVLVHPNATIAKDVEIGAGSVIMPGAVINPGANVGKGVIVNTSSSVDHDCVIGDFVHIAVGAHLSGTVVIGDNVWIGTGAIVSNNVNICGGCTIGAGAVVIRDIDIPGIYIGVPAMIYKKYVTPPEIKLNLVSRFSFGHHSYYNHHSCMIVPVPVVVKQRKLHRRAA